MPAYSKIKLSSFDRQRVLQAIAFIKENPEVDLKIRVIAREVGISEHKLKAGFHLTVGVSIGHYIIGIRLDYATGLLKTTDLPLKMIASKIHIRHRQYFCTLFKKKFGITPGEYRKLFYFLMKENSIEL